MPAANVGTVTRVQSWRQRIPDFRRLTERLRVPNDVCVNGMVSRLVLQDLREQAAV